VGTESYQSFNVESESLRDTQEQIELWTTGNVSLPGPDETPNPKETYVCYGTVSRPYLRAPRAFGNCAAAI
jgi:hypothetical protein